MPITSVNLAVGTVDSGLRVVKVIDGATAKYVWEPVTGDRVFETLTVTARNTIANLAQTPAGAVEFHVNGVTVPAGLTVTGVSITVNAATVGFNIDPGVDVVTAEYPV